MRKLMTVLVLMLGLTFIYNAQSNSGFVYINADPANWIILVDSNMNVLRYYRATVTGEERLDYGLEAWIQDKVNKGLPFKSMIIPFRQQQQQGR
jgi:hypothetical protein